MNTPHAPHPAVASRPTPAELQDAEWALRSMQRLLGTLGRDKRRESPVFKELMDDYKHLGTNLHVLRREVAAAEQATVKALAASRAATPGQAGMSLLGRVRDLKGLPPAVAPARSAPPLGALPVAPPAASAPATSRANGEAARPTQAPDAGGDPPLQRVAPPTLEHPLALPRIAGTLGPPHTKAIDLGPPVAYLQRLLAALGYDVNETELYDNKTFRAVQEFQLSRQLPVNGIVGLETRRLLNELVTGEEAGDVDADC